MLWMDDGACLTEDPELFFPDGTAMEIAKKSQVAKAICHGCAVMDQCLDWALESDQVEGIWGGQNLRERRRHQRRLENFKQGRSAA